MLEAATSVTSKTGAKMLSKEEIKERLINLRGIMGDKEFTADKEGIQKDIIYIFANYFSELIDRDRNKSAFEMSARIAINKFPDCSVKERKFLHSLLPQLLKAIFREDGEDGFFPPIRANVLHNTFLGE